MAPANVVRARATKELLRPPPTPLMRYQVFAINISKVAAIARSEVSTLLAMCTVLENKKTATKSQTNKCQKTMNQSNEKKRLHLKIYVRKNTIESEH